MSDSEDAIRPERNRVPLLTKVIERLDQAQQDLELAIQTTPVISDLVSIGNVWRDILEKYRIFEAICKDVERRLFSEGCAAGSHSYRLKRYGFKTDVGRSCAYF